MATEKQQKASKIPLRNIIRSLTEEDKKKIYIGLHGGIDATWSYFYVLKCCDFYKIGFAFNISSRVSNMQTGNPNIIEIVYSVKHPQAKMLEKRFHGQFADKKHRGEWFRLDEYDIIGIKLFVEESWNHVNK